jgi:hypothetical protein
MREWSNTNQMEEKYEKEIGMPDNGSFPVVDLIGRVRRQSLSGERIPGIDDRRRGGSGEDSCDRRRTGRTGSPVFRPGMGSAGKNRMG